MSTAEPSILKKRKKKPTADDPPPPQPKGDDADPTLAALLDPAASPASAPAAAEPTPPPKKKQKKHPASAASAASSAATATAPATPTTTPPLPQQQPQPAAGEEEAKREKKKKKKKDKQGDDGSGKAAPRRRLLIPGAGHDDSFLYTLQAAGVEGHEYDEYVLIDKLEAMVGGEDDVAVTQSRFESVLQMRFGEPTMHKKDRHILEFFERGRHPIKYKYQRDPATLTPEKLGDGDIYLTAFARRPGLKVTGAPGAAAPGFNPTAWDAAVYLAPGRRVFVCEPPGEGGKPGPLAAALPATANVVRLSEQAQQWAARLPVRDRNVLRDVITHERRQAKTKDGGTIPSSDDETDGRKKRGRKTPPKTPKMRKPKRPSPAQAAKKKQAPAAAGEGAAAGNGAKQQHQKKKKKPKVAYKFNPFVR